MSDKRQTLTVAMPKGRIFSETVELFRSAGIPLPTDFSESSRKLIIPLEEAGFTFFLAKPTDVPTYVEYGVADIGIVGKDVLMEEERNVYELLDLSIGQCRMCVAGPPHTLGDPFSRVATKYPRTASRYFRGQGQQVEVIKLNGSVELAPLIGLAERIVDIVSTGRTLKENGLVEEETITTITSRLIANRASYRMKAERIDQLCRQVREVVEGSEQYDTAVDK